MSKNTGGRRRARTRGRHHRWRGTQIP